MVKVSITSKLKKGYPIWTVSKFLKEDLKLDSEIFNLDIVLAVAKTTKIDGFLCLVNVKTGITLDKITWTRFNLTYNENWLLFTTLLIHLWYLYTCIFSYHHLISWFSECKYFLPRRKSSILSPRFKNKSLFSDPENKIMQKPVTFRLKEKHSLLRISNAPSQLKK